MGRSTHLRHRRAAWCRAPAAWILVVTVAISSVDTLGAAGAGPPVTASWTGLPLRAACERLTDLVGRPVLLDRRVDPDVTLTLELRASPLQETLERICREAGVRCVVLPASIRVLPPDRAGALLAAERERTAVLAAAPPRVRKVAEGRRTWSWADGATPSDLLAAAAEEAGLAIGGLDGLPHDHLRGAALPSLPLAERLDLLLLQYDRRIDWKRARATGGKVEVDVAGIDVAAPAPDGPAVVAAAGAWASFRGPLHEGNPGATWSLEVAAPLEALLATVADRLGLRLDLDREGLRRRGVAAGGIVRLAVKEVSREELLDRIVGPLGLSWSIDGDRLVVGPGGE